MSATPAKRYYVSLGLDLKGQVPMVMHHSSKTGLPLLVGSGRLAKHLSHYFSLIGLDHSTWSRSQPMELLKKQIQSCSFIMLAISDDSLESFYIQHIAQTDLKVIHFSGSFVHPKMAGFHPLMTFTHKLYELNFYKEIYFAVSDLSLFKKLLPQISNPCFSLSEEEKGQYHAWAVLMAAGTQSLWKYSMKQMKSFGVPDQASEIYLRQIAQQFFLDNENSMTGPWVRNDLITMQKNKASFKNQQDRALYENLQEKAKKE